MTTIVIVKNENFIFLAADTRRTFEYLKEDGSIKDIKTEDGLQKILKTKTGYIAGAGWEDLIFEVNNSIIEKELDNLEDISNEIIEIKNRCMIEYPKKIEDINKTSWVITHQYPNGEINAFYFNSIKNELTEIKKEVFLLSFPNVDNKEILEVFNEEELRKMKTEEEKAFYCIIKIIYTPVNNSNYSSKDFYIAKIYKDQENEKEIIYIDK